MERARGRREKLFCCFVDLAKAYDSVPRAKLMQVLASELGIAAGTVKCIARMYESVRASVLLGKEYSRPFDMREGVRQGCPASPLIFSLYMDRLETFLRSEVVAGLSGEEKAAIRLSGSLIPLLLFADDIVIMATSLAVV